MTYFSIFTDIFTGFGKIGSFFAPPQDFDEITPLFFILPKPKNH
jgi:adenosylmethionine-8-amino-7-oxononanoate aminotransferase